MGNAYSDSNKFKETIEAYKTAIEINSTIPQAHNNLTLTLRKT
jgi:hypothetical protein